MTSVTDICNWALSEIGVAEITSITDGSVEADACLRLYDLVRRGELADHNWVFALERFELTADATNPPWGKDRRYLLPPNWIRMAWPYREDDDTGRDWEVEGRYILSDEKSPLRIRCVVDVEDVSLWHAKFPEVVAKKLGSELAIPLADSRGLKEMMVQETDKARKMAEKVQAIQRVKKNIADPSWLQRRRG